MNNQVIKFDDSATDIQTVEALNRHINDVLGRYTVTQGVILEWGLKINAETELAEPMTLSQIVKRSQDARGMSGEGKEAKAARKAEFDAIKAIFDIERINDKIEILFRHLDYVPRFTGISKAGVGGMQFVPRWKAEKDAVGKTVVRLQGESRAAKSQAALEEIFGKDAVARYMDGQITKDQLRAMPSLLGE